MINQSPSKVYTREYLLSFKHSCQSPPKSLDQVIQPLYLDPGSPFPSSPAKEKNLDTPSKFPEAKTKSPSKTPKNPKTPKTPSLLNDSTLTKKNAIEKTPSKLTKKTSTIEATPTKRTPLSTIPSKAPSTPQQITPLRQTIKNQHSTFINKENILNSQQSKLPLPPVPAIKPLMLEIPSVQIPKLVLPLTPPAPKKEKPISSPPDSTTSPDEHRLAQRQKQIDYGYNTVGYQKYIETIPKVSRISGVHPDTPRKRQNCSKRSWDGQIRKWRRDLHDFDALVSENERVYFKAVLNEKFGPNLAEDDGEVAFHEGTKIDPRTLVF